MKKAIVPLIIIFLLTICLIVYTSQFSVVTTIEMKGYALSNNTIVSNLANAEAKDTITYEEVNVNDTLYRFGNKYYVGESKRKYVSKDFPIISSDFLAAILFPNCFSANCY